MFSHTFNGLTYSDTSSSSTSSSPNFTQSPHQFHHAPTPDVPSTFLPSYYPEGRHASMDREPSNPDSNGEPSRTHSPATWELLSQAGPSSRHLLDGTNIIEPRPRPYGEKREMRPPEYRISPNSIASSFVNKASSTTPSFPMDPTSSSLGSGSQYPGSSFGTDTGGGGGGGGGGGRYHPYSHPRESDRGMSTGAGSGGGSISRNSNNGHANTTPNPSNNYSNTSLPEPTPSSTAYPGNMYANIPLPERPEVEQWDRGDNGPTGEDYAQALEIYNYMLEAVPSIRPHNDPNHQLGGQRYDHLLNLSHDGLSYLNNPQPGMGHGQIQLHPGQIPYSDPTSTHTPGAPTLLKRPAPPASGPGNGDKKSTKCLGCGATETPEWRRGPMGPRTLCNACGLVHMKLQRKKKKQEEKAAAAARDAK